MHRSSNWDDLRYVLAVAKAGSVSQAARELGVNHATVLRHVAAFERETGAEIFKKSATGYTINDDRIRVIDAARDVESAVLAVEQIIGGAKAPVHGLVRVTSTDSFCQIVLPSLICEIHDTLKNLRIDLLSTNSRMDFSRLGADIAIRPTERLSDDMRGDVAATLGFDIYHALNHRPDQWLGLSGSLERSMAARWMAHNVSTDKITGSADSFLALRELAACGLGQAVLPCIVGDSDVRLQRRSGIFPDMQVNLWVATHAGLTDVPRIKAVQRMLIDALSKDSARLAGRT